MFYQKWQDKIHLLLPKADIMHIMNITFKKINQYFQIHSHKEFQFY